MDVIQIFFQQKELIFYYYNILQLGSSVSWLVHCCLSLGCEYTLLINQNSCFT